MYGVILTAFGFGAGSGPGSTPGSGPGSGAGSGTDTPPNPSASEEKKNYWKDFYANRYKEKFNTAAGNDGRHARVCEGLFAFRSTPPLKRCKEVARCAVCQYPLVPLPVS